VILASLLFALCTARADVRDLPLIELPAKHPAHRRFAIMLTGDGGWRRIDERVTRRLRDAGLPVVGFRTPDYFRTGRTPEESACALERVIRFYKASWKCDRVVIVGYSRGADVLPFMLSRLPADLRASTGLVALLGLEPAIDFRYHASWIPFHHSNEPQHLVKPELEKLRGMRLLCVYGAKEKDSLCPSLDPQVATSVREPGSHHFAGRYTDVADVILAHIAEPRAGE
jgi:type IV secretory pathway VirJ component